MRVAVSRRPAGELRGPPVPDTIAVFVVSDDRAADMRKTGANLVRFTRNQQQFKCTRSAVR